MATSLFDITVIDRASAPGGNVHEDCLIFGVTTSMLVKQTKVALHSARSTIPENKPLRLIFCGDDMVDDRTLGSYSIHAGQLAHLIVCRATAPLVFAKTSSGLTTTFVTKPGHCNEREVLSLKQNGGVGGAPHLHMGLSELLDRQPDLSLAMRDVEEALAAASSQVPSEQESTPPSEPIPAAYLAATITTHKFGDSVPRKPTFLVVGGVHGNETCGMLGVEALAQYLRAAEGKLARHLLAHARVIVVPCANRVGMLCARKRLLDVGDPIEAWGVRSCPTPGCNVNYGEGRVWGIPIAQKGSEPPIGWQDPNRGWDDNETFVKQHIEELLTQYSPEICMFSHDWAPTKSMLVLNCPNVPEETYDGIAPIFERNHSGFILATDRSEKSAKGDRERPLTRVLLEEKGVQSYTLETYFMGGANSVKTHFEALLFLLCRHSGFNGPTEELIREVGIAARITIPVVVAGADSAVW